MKRVDDETSDSTERCMFSVCVCVCACIYSERHMGRTHQSVLFFHGHILRSFKIHTRRTLFYGHGEVKK